MGYEGEEASQPLPVVLEEIEPGLPPPGMAGCLDPRTYVSREVKEFLDHPEEALLPSHLRPCEVKTATVNVRSDDEWIVIATRFG